MKVLLFGAKGDIGRAILCKMEQSNITVISSDIIASQLKNYHQCDLTQEDQIQALFEVLRDSNISAIVNASGKVLFKTLEETTSSEWDSCFYLNVRAPFLINQNALKFFKANLRIVHISSIADYNFLEGNGAYSASKVGLKAMSQIFNKENYQKKVYSTTLSLGAVATSVWDNTHFDKNDMLSVDQVAEAVINIAKLPLDTRMDEVKLLPPKGIL